MGGMAFQLYGEEVGGLILIELWKSIEIIYSKRRVILASVQGYSQLAVFDPV